jgi:hypothetical protein
VKAKNYLGLISVSKGFLDERDDFGWGEITSDQAFVGWRDRVKT